MLPVLARSIDHALRSLSAAALLAVASASGRSLSAQPAAPPGALLTTTLGDCHLSGGTVLRECRVAYRTYGRLSPTRDNVVLIPTFFAGRSEDHQFMVGDYVDSTRYHVIIVDALADGHSASPSNAGGAAAFATLTIADMVDVQHRFLTEQLGLRRVRAVVGISMGGFQAFEWAVRYPTFADAIVPIVATPRLTPYDRLIFESWRRSAEALDGPHTHPDSAWMQASRLETLFMRTIRFGRDSGDAYLSRSAREMATAYQSASWSLADYAAQLRALGSHDISARFGGDMNRAAAAVRARMLIVYSPDDILVDPRPAAAFAQLVGAETLAVPSDCGHAVFWCEAGRIGAAVREFLARQQSVTGQ
jgi:homoserine O-acetyltransferase